MRIKKFDNCLVTLYKAYGGLKVAAEFLTNDIIKQSNSTNATSRCNMKGLSLAPSFPLCLALYPSISALLPSCWYGCHSLLTLYWVLSTWKWSENCAWFLVCLLYPLSYFWSRSVSWTCWAHKGSRLCSYGECKKEEKCEIWTAPFRDKQPLGQLSSAI